MPMLVPALVVLVAIGLFPLLHSLWISLQRFAFAGTTSFGGLDNYARLVSDGRFWNALGNTAFIATLAVGLELVLGLLLALALKPHGWETRVLPLFMLPMMVAPVVAAIVWMMLLHPTIGLFNHALAIVGVAPVAWLTDPAFARPSIIAADVWQWTPFMFLIIRAGVLAVPVDQIEAARLDGAGRFSLFRNVYLPNLTLAIAVALLIRAIDVVKLFDLIWVMTKGGPGNFTETLSVYVYRTAFVDFNSGYAAAIAYVQFAVVGILGWAFIRWTLRGRTG